jgi:putative hydrolase of the HAD superfamily
VKTIIFDFGNVVGFFDHMRTLRRLEPFTDMPAEEMFHRIYASDLEDAFESNLIDELEFLRQFKQVCRLTCECDVLAQALADIFWPNPEICALIPKLAPRYQILLGSNTNPIHSRRFREQFADVFRHFDALILSHEIGVRKPRPGFFQQCQTLAKGSVNECLFLDDIPENVAGARQHGWKAIVYHPNDGLFMKLRAAGVDV